MSKPLAIHPGDRLMVTTAFDVEILGVADSEPEGAGPCRVCTERLGSKMSHHFPIVWVIVTQRDGTPSQRIPWPLESVRKVDTDE